MALAPISALPLSGASSAGLSGQATVQAPAARAGWAPAPFQLPAAVELPMAPPPGAAAVTSAAPYEAQNWGQMLQQVVRDVNARQATAGDLVRDVLAGGKTTPHAAVIAMEEASISFQLLAEMRNKMVESYQEVMRMQV